MLPTHGNPTSFTSCHGYPSLQLRRHPAPEADRFSQLLKCAAAKQFSVTVRSAYHVWVVCSGKVGGGVGHVEGVGLVEGVEYVEGWGM